jgi:hypothetical protein
MKKLLLAKVPTWITLCLVLFGIGVAITLGVSQMPPRDPLGDRFAQLKTGMSLARVADIMGDTGLDPKPIVYELTQVDEGERPSKIRYWTRVRNAKCISVVWVFFGEKDEVIGKRWYRN